MAPGWNPWTEREDEGLGRLVTVEIPGPFADEIKRIAWRLRISPEAVLSGAVASGIAFMTAQGDALAKAYARQRGARK